MTIEQKELLLKDLSSRFPYGVKIYDKYVDTDTEVEKAGVLSMIDNDKVVAFTCDDTNCYNYVAIHEVKPYLFPFDSMTEEQKKEYDKIIYRSIELHHREYSDIVEIDLFDDLQEFYHKNHFDYRGLIPMGLAIDATNLNIY